MRSLELRRHAPREKGADALTPEGRVLAEDVGRGLSGTYDALFTSTAQRAAETAAWFLRGLGHPLPRTHAALEELLSPVEDRWRAAVNAAGSADLDAIEQEDLLLVQAESQRLGGVLRDLLGRVPEGGRALVIGHAPLLEAGVRGLTGGTVRPLEECEGLLLVEDAGDVRVDEEYRLADA